MKIYYAGIDYHKHYSVVCILDQAGERIVEGTVKPNTAEQFEIFFSQLDGPVRATYECGLNWGYLFDVLESIQAVERIILANAFRVKIIAEAQIKTDKIDARKLAWLLRAGLIPAIHIPDAFTRSRREVIRQRLFWVKTRTRIRNRIHRIIERQHDLNMPEVTDVFGRKGKAALNSAVLEEPDAALLRQNLEALNELDRFFRENEAHMKKISKEDSDTQILTSIPGVGLTIGSVLASEIDGIERFKTPEKLCAYAGLVPSTYSSGGKTRNGRMLSGCNKWLKWGFIEAAWVAVGCNAYFGGLYRAQKARGKKANTAITIVARRMCRIVWHLLSEQRKYQERMYKQNASGCSHLGLTKPSRVA